MQVNGPMGSVVIMQRLNEDCIYKVIDYLSLSDCFNLAFSDPGMYSFFYNVSFKRDYVSDVRIMRIGLDMYDVVFFGPSEAAYDQTLSLAQVERIFALIGHRIQQMFMCRITEAFPPLRHCVNVRKALLSDCSLADMREDMNHLGQLEELVLDNMATTAVTGGRILRKNLTVIDIITTRP